MDEYMHIFEWLKPSHDQNLDEPWTIKKGGRNIFEVFMVQVLAYNIIITF